MSIRQLFRGFIFLLLCFSCKNNYDIIDEKLPEGSIKLRYNVQLQVSDDLLLEITKIKDSRCPVGAFCAEAGMVTVDLRVLASEGTETSTLYFSEIPNSVQNIDTVVGYKIEIVEVTPIPYINKPIESDSLYSVYVIANKL